MSVNDAFDVDLDRLLTDWLEADAAPRAPESLETAFVEAVARTRQRPAWATTERWISMETRAQLGVMPRALILILTLALLVAALAASLALAGNLTRADDGGDPLAGLTYFTQEGVIQRHASDESGDPVRLTGDDEFALGPFWSPDGTRFAYVSAPDSYFQGPSPEGPFTVMVRDADGSNPVAVSEPLESEPFPLVWSPDGSRLLFAADDPDVAKGAGRCPLPGSFCEKRIWSAASDGSAPAWVIGDPALAARAPLWTPDGESIIFAGSDDHAFDYGVYRMDADGANAERIGDLTGYGYSLDRLSISPDGTTVVVSAGPDKYDLYLVDLATGEDVLIAGEDELDEVNPLWSPDGSQIAFTRWGRAITDASQAMLYDVASREAISLDIELDARGWSPNSRHIVGDGPDGLTVVDVTDPTAPVATPVEGLTQAFGPSWQPGS